MILFPASQKRLFPLPLLLAGFFLSCNTKQSPPPHRSEIATSSSHPSERHEALEPGSLPDAKLTPGAKLEVTKEDICTPGYTKKVRDVPIAVKRQVYAEYHTPYVRGADEVDHLIPLELGGSNSIRNLWPEPFDIPWGAHVKDHLENRLHELVCEGSVPLETAQNWIGHDWIATYKRVFHTNQPRTTREYKRNSHRLETR